MWDINYVEPSTTDKEDLRRKNRACSAKALRRRVDETIPFIDSEIKKFQDGKKLLTNFEEFLNLYIKGLEGSSDASTDPPWFPLMEQTLALIKQLEGIEDDSVRERAEALCFETFLTLNPDNSLKPADE